MAKKKNKRICLILLETKDGLALLIRTKRLIDYKKREILNTEVLYGMETLALIHQVTDMLFNDDEVSGTMLKEIEALKDELTLRTNIGFLG